MAERSTGSVLLDGRNLGPAEVAGVAREGRAVRLDDAAWARNAAAAEALAGLVAEGTPVYGLTTGVGTLRTEAVPASERAGQQLRLLRSHACGAGRPLARDQVRAAMVVRANQLGAGGAGVSDDLLGALLGALNAGFVPFTRELGSLGTGDLTVLADIALALLGEGRAWPSGAPAGRGGSGARDDAGSARPGGRPAGPGEASAGRGVGSALLGEGRAREVEEPVPAAGALGDAGLVAPRLGPRDGIAFMSSNAASIGHAALVAVDADRLLSRSLAVAALSFTAAGADPSVLDPRVHAARGHPGQVAVAARLRDLLGSGAAAVPEPPGPGAADARPAAPGRGAAGAVPEPPGPGTADARPATPGRGAAGARSEAPDRGVAAARGPGSREPIHDAYPFRALAQVEGPTLDALNGLEAVLAVELNAAGENALVDPGPPAAVLSTANFHAGALALALDRLRAALAQSSSLVAARVSALLDPGLTGLPATLAARPGQDSGAMMLEYTAHAAAADVRLRAAPAAAQTTTVGGGVESHASFAPLAARGAQEALESAAVAVATELVVAVRALRMRGLAPAGTSAGDLFAAAAERLDADLSDRALSDDVEAARTLLFGASGASPAEAHL